MGSKTVKVPIGMRSSYFAKIKTEPENAHPTYDSKVDMGAAVKGYVSITTASGGAASALSLHRPMWKPQKAISN